MVDVFSQDDGWDWDACIVAAEQVDESIALRTASISATAPSLRGETVASDEEEWNEACIRELDKVEKTLAAPQDACIPRLTQQNEVYAGSADCAEEDMDDEWNAACIRELDRIEKHFESGRNAGDFNESGEGAAQCKQGHAGALSPNFAHQGGASEDPEWNKACLRELEKFEQYAAKQHSSRSCNLRELEPCSRCLSPMIRSNRTQGKYSTYVCCFFPWCAGQRNGKRVGCIVDAEVTEVVAASPAASLKYTIVVTIREDPVRSESSQEICDMLLGVLGADALVANSPCADNDKYIRITVPATPANFDALTQALQNVRQDASIRFVPKATEKFFKKTVAHPRESFRPSVSEHRDMPVFLPSKLREALVPFQREGVQYALIRKGRCLIADEMGTGKTLQAIAIAACYRSDWPLLIVVPAALRLYWVDEIERWLELWLVPNDINVVYSSADAMYESSAALRPRVTIISYHMLHRLKETVGSWEWGCCIVDESHFLTTKQSKTLDSPLVVTCLEVIRKSKRAILLSGTPSLSRPFDIFNQVDALQPGLLGASRRQFASSYCRGTKVQVLQESRGDVRTVVSCSGLTHSSELNSLLRESVMIRRLKCDVLSQLPPMRRTVIRVEPSNKDLQSALLSRKEKGLTASMSAYQQEGLKKVPRAVEWLVDKVGGCGSEVKFVIFAHHVMVMDALQRGFELCGEFAKLSCNPVLRIDGEVDQKSRKERLRDFHADPCSRIMLVSTTAGGQGIDISCASVRLFDRLNYVV